MPIVEPDVSLSGTHTLEQAVDINIKIQAELYKAMIDHGVYMPGSTLKPNIINPGKNCPVGYTVEQIAEANIYVLEQAFPVAMKGANFLSGGQSLEQGTARLSAMNKVKGNGPWWPLSLSLSVLLRGHRGRQTRLIRKATGEKGARRAVRSIELAASDDREGGKRRGQKQEGNSLGDLRHSVKLGLV